MKKISLMVGVGALTALAVAAFAQTLEEGFRSPPVTAKPQTWFHLMNGNVTKEGITRDFEEIAKVGLGGVQIFDAGCDIPSGTLDFGTQEWYDMLRHAHNEAKRLGLMLGIPCGDTPRKGFLLYCLNNEISMVSESFLALRIFRREFSFSEVEHRRA